MVEMAVWQILWLVSPATWTGAPTSNSGLPEGIVSELYSLEAARLLRQWKGFIQRENFQGHQPAKSKMPARCIGNRKAKQAAWQPRASKRSVATYPSERRPELYFVLRDFRGASV